MEQFDLSRIERINPNLNLREGDFPDLGPGGIEDSFLTDGEHIILECSNCKAPLVDIWVTQPDLILKSKLRAECAHCGDKSFEKEVSGGFHLGSTDYSEISDVKYLNANFEGTLVTNQDVLITTVKGKEYG